MHSVKCHHKQIVRYVYRLHSSRQDSAKLLRAKLSNTYCLPGALKFLLASINLLWNGQCDAMLGPQIIQLSD